LDVSGDAAPKAAAIVSPGAADGILAVIAYLIVTAVGSGSVVKCKIAIVLLNYFSGTINSLAAIVSPDNIVDGAGTATRPNT
jgi:hypothetical protein